ncbi:MAG: 3-phosphoshikimate 1-carboxyvinyltransferase [Acidobacteria bacterium]|nr:MAG: 3-phosphoshikimate 1-carboxyvinyltransferase [Acidobacteriota bacterium]PYY01874.1 MAG: 3-phosphoshikimate 1-carboxyvinyltransferase [Acidobacteriota bacterium]PYY21858.1 MAG: 3-phosphoshikimate 1-carboxyvinyltransferase [Acidobacteriota bacterium]
MKDVIIKPARNLVGSIRLPGDKSISHRYAMLAALAEGTTRLRNFSSGGDCASTLNCLRSLGVNVARANGEITITSHGGELQAPHNPLDCGNSGSTMRMLSGILAGQPFAAEMIGDESLSRRPMRRVIEPLTQMGAIISSEDGHAPLHIKGGKLRSIDYKPQVASAQVKSSVLFAGLFSNGETSVEEPVRTRDHGEMALRAFGAKISRDKNRVSISGGQQLKAIEAAVPGDISSAAFFLCAAALFPESNLVIDSLLLNPTRAVLLDVLTCLGARVRMVQVEEQHGELMGTVAVEAGSLKGIALAGAQSAALIDEIPVLAAIAPYTRDGLVVHDARELRVKESDRIAAVARNLRAMGATVTEHEDGLTVPGGQRPHGAEIDSEHDHRIAMAFAIAALRAEGDTLIHGADAAQISFPEFFEMLEGVLER